MLALCDCFSQEIIPFIDEHWEQLTVAPRRVKHTWHSSIAKTMVRNLCHFWPTVLSVAPLVQSVVCNVLYSGETAGPICMKFSGKVWSDHGTTRLHFGSIRVNRAMPITRIRLDRFAWMHYSFCIDRLLWGSTVGHPSNSWASCLLMLMCLIGSVSSTMHFIFNSLLVSFSSFLMFSCLYLCQLWHKKVIAGRFSISTILSHILIEFL